MCTLKSTKFLRSAKRKKEKEKKGAPEQRNYFAIMVDVKMLNVENPTDVDFYTIKKQMSNQFLIHCI